MTVTREKPQAMVVGAGLAGLAAARSRGILMSFTSGADAEKLGLMSGEGRRSASMNGAIASGIRVAAEITGKPLESFRVRIRGAS